MSARRTRPGTMKSAPRPTIDAMAAGYAMSMPRNGAAPAKAASATTRKIAIFVVLLMICSSSRSCSSLRKSSLGRSRFFRDQFRVFEIFEVVALVGRLRRSGRVGVDRAERRREHLHGNSRGELHFREALVGLPEL